MPDLRPAANTAALLAALPLTDPTRTTLNLKGWLTRDLAAQPFPRAWLAPGAGAASERTARPAVLSTVESEVLRVVGALQDCMPAVTPARAVELVVSALSKATVPLCLEALRTIGDVEYLEGRV
jgi:hypothetical protein